MRTFSRLIIVILHRGYFTPVVLLPPGKFHPGIIRRYRNVIHCPTVIFPPKTPVSGVNQTHAPLGLIFKMAHMGLEQYLNQVWKAAKFLCSEIIGWNTDILLWNILGGKRACVQEWWHFSGKCRKRCTHVFRLCDCVVLIEETSLYIGEVRLNSLTVTVARDVSVDCRELWNLKFILFCMSILSNSHIFNQIHIVISQKPIICLLDSQSETNLRSRRLEVKGARKNGVCEGDTQRERDRCFYLLSESAKNSSWLMGSRGDKCLP